MGLYDTLRCHLPLPVAGANALEFQTKDTPAQSLDDYEIRADGTLWHKVCDEEDRSDPTATGMARFAGLRTRVNERWVPEKMTGGLRFYHSTGPEEWVEFEAVLVDGQVVALTPLSPAGHRESYPWPQVDAVGSVPDFYDRPQLRLAPGPRLYLEPTGSTSDSIPGERVVPSVPENLADQAHRFLYVPVELEAGVTLADVLGLLRYCLQLQDIFWRDFAADLSVEVALGAVPEQLADPRDRCEVIELGWRFYRHSHLRQVHRWPHMDVRGRGVLQTEDYTSEGRTCPAGSRLSWSLSLCPLREILALPVELSHIAQVFEDDIDAKRYGHLLEEVRYRGTTLGEVIDGLVHELSFHGTPSDVAQVRQAIQAQLDDVKLGTASFVSHDSARANADSLSCDRLFDSLGGHSPAQVRRVIFEIEDDAPAARVIAARLGSEVLLKSAFARLTGRQLRAEFRTAL